jgi:shikimate kinase
MKEVIILVGEMGCGKTYWGKKIANELGLEFYDGDKSLPYDMKDRVARFIPLTKEMVDDYIHNHLAPAIRWLVKDDGLVVAQALYMKEHRDFLKKHLEKNGCVVTYWYLQTPFWQNLKQLWSRPKGFRWILYWLMNKPFFQKDGLDASR